MAARTLRQTGALHRQLHLPLQHRLIQVMRRQPPPHHGTAHDPRDLLHLANERRPAIRVIRARISPVLGTSHPSVATYGRPVTNNELLTSCPRVLEKRRGRLSASAKESSLRRTGSVCYPGLSQWKQVSGGNPSCRRQILGSAHLPASGCDRRTRRRSRASLRRAPLPPPPHRRCSDSRSP